MSPNKADRENNGRATRLCEQPGLGVVVPAVAGMADEKNYDLLNALDLQKRATWAIIGSRSYGSRYRKQRFYLLTCQVKTLMSFTNWD